MSEQVGMKDIEKKARSALRQDGIATMIAGLSFVLIAPFFLDDRFGMMLILGTGLYVFLPEIIRKHYIYPRVGYVKVRKESSKKWKMAISILLLLLFVVILKLGAFNYLMPLYLAVIFSAIAFTIAYLYKTTVEYFLGAIILISGIVGLMLTAQGNDPGLVTALQLCIIGAVFVVFGFVQFSLFVRKYPAKEEQLNETIS